MIDMSPSQPIQAVTARAAKKRVEKHIFHGRGLLIEEASAHPTRQFTKPSKKSIADRRLIDGRRRMTDTGAVIPIVLVRRV